MSLRWFGARRARRRDAGKRGQGIVEFAFALPLMLMLLLGTLDFGQMFFDYIELRNAVREGASYGARNPDDAAGIEERVQRHGDRVADAVVDSVCTGDCDTVGATGTITVTGELEFEPIMLGFAQQYMGLGPITLTSSSDARILS